ncbi:unnamed protein product [Notodromas monacha]|uniref:Uncharacterized protein n=1 Tax=Notodromas monacha TaxID=399045 RepID=A0A7R9BTR1_9CRUS|nr:unnamed protein product [Notodromas monacha]CAG0921578.1 unnamed protein product [Notodromas monacha]
MDNEFAEELSIYKLSSLGWSAAHRNLSQGDLGIRITLDASDEQWNAKFNAERDDGSDTTRQA